MTDILIPYRRGGSDGEELRYALRSIDTHLGDAGQAWVIGDTEPWFTGGHIPTERVGKHVDGWRYLDQVNAWKAYAEHPDTAEHAAAWMDDVFLMGPIPTTPVFHNGYLDEVVGLMRPGNAWYADAHRSVLAKAGYRRIWCFEQHGPLPVTKAGIRATLPFLTTAAEYALKKTVYGAVNNLDGVKGCNNKVGKPGATQPLDEALAWVQQHPELPFLSTNDSQFASGEVGRIIRAKFPTPSRWEE